jgi:hypothetical protein
MAFGRIRIGRENDAVDKAANDLCHIASGVFAVERCDEIPDFIAVDRPYLRADIDGFFVGSREEALQFAFAAGTPTLFSRRVGAHFSCLRHHGEASILLKSQPLLCTSGGDRG